MRRLIPSMFVAGLVTVLGPASNAIAQGGPYAFRGGPTYGGPIYGGGPSLFAGAYSQPYFGPQLSGAGFGAMYIGAYPQFNSVRANASVPYYGANIVPMYAVPGVVYNPIPPRPPETIPVGPPSPDGSRSGSTEASPTTPRTAPAAGTAPLPGARPVQPAIGRAWFNVAVPADAKIWVNDAATVQAGTSRRFHTPADLDPLRIYEYVFRAQWTDGTQVVTRDKTVRFKAGDDLAVDFTQAAAR